jgi:hypothetical protein
LKRIIGVVAVAAAFAVPVVAVANDQPTSTDKQNASQQCKALLKAAGKTNFAATWGKNANKKNAFGKCVSTMAKQEAQQRQDAQSNAAKDCKTEKAQSDADFQAAHNGQTFAQFYGAKNANSAYGKCVSTKAKQNKAEADQKDKDTVSAAKYCKGQQSQDAAGFKKTYRNFGACVSKKAHELNAQRQQEQQTQTTQS